MKKNHDKVRTSVFIPKHLKDLGEKIFKSNSKFAIIAMTHFINTGGLKRYLNDREAIEKEFLKK